MYMPAERREGTSCMKEHVVLVARVQGDAGGVH